jgi:glutathione S-transferase
MILYELEFGLYPRRVSIYLQEKGLTNVERRPFDLNKGWPPAEMPNLSQLGTVPILVVDKRTVIRSSVAILEYLEERFPDPTMLGDTLEERARTREFVALAEEATTMVSFWMRKVSPVFNGREEANLDAGRLGGEWYYRRLRQIDALMAERDGEFLTGGKVTIADTITYALMQFSHDLYDVSLPDDTPRLMAWYDRFAQRPSACAVAFPAPLREAAKGLPSRTAGIDPVVAAYTGEAVREG